MRVAVLMALVVAGCGGAASRFVDDARRANERADALILRGEPGHAMEALQALVAAPVPAGVAEPDRRAVLQDAYARLAGLAAAGGNAAQALQFAQSGLALGGGRDVFEVSLRMELGKANEALGRDSEAARDYEAAQVIAESLLETALREGGDR